MSAKKRQGWGREEEKGGYHVVDDGLMEEGGEDSAGSREVEPGQRVPLLPAPWLSGRMRIASKAEGRMMMELKGG